ncbi:MAG: putative co-chaperone Hsc20 [Myxococcales bacterium]|nr:putative co-chaperone Hsc20 [Myxococcales bacterium]
MANPSISKTPSHEVPQGADAFALLGLTPAFDVDLAVLEKAFFERSKELHPDRFASAPAHERVVALSKSRALNDAYTILKKPVSRAEYLLGRAGVTIGDNERLDPASLMPILEDREQLQDAIHGKRLTEVAKLQTAMQATRARELELVREQFALVEEARRAGGPQASVDEPIAQIKKILILMRYVDRYLEACDAALDEE